MATDSTDRQKEKVNKYIESILDTENTQRKQQTYADILAKYWGDPDFKAKMDADPSAVLKEEGYDVPAGASVKLVFNTPNRIHVVLPNPERD